MITVKKNIREATKLRNRLSTRTPDTSPHLKKNQKIASTNAPASNACRSSMPSPTPM